MTEPHRPIVMVGALNADLGIRVAALPRPGETVGGHDVEVSSGGKASNQAVAAARLGASVRLVGAVGADDNGRLLRERASASGVDVSSVRTLPDVTTGQAIIPVDDAGENLIILVPGANGALSPKDLDPAAFVDASVVCLSLEIALDTVTEAALLAHAVGALVVFNPSPAADRLPYALGAVDVLIVNEVEAGQLLGRELDLSSDAEASAFFAAVRDRGVAAAIVTLGAQGALVLRDGVVDRVPARRVEVVDTTGCGDAFTGAVAVGLAAGRPLEQAARSAIDVAGYAAEHRGAQASYPTTEQLAAWRPGR